MASLSSLHATISYLSSRSRIRDGRFEATSAVRAATVIDSIVHHLSESGQTSSRFPRRTDFAIAICNDLIAKKVMAMVIPDGVK